MIDWISSMRLSTAAYWSPMLQLSAAEASAWLTLHWLMTPLICADSAPVSASTDSSLSTEFSCMIVAMSCSRFLIASSSSPMLQFSAARANS
eukprot:CAMPEP_0173084818 /NCGR_PEP_ID=MMETSP1102-20130122/20980_1 /TAXON_ID=49646 /ORGANISM="Geminigera sp., Strain Caron Lab Isolate" /LENGTH=91 /DNA_ID=CAMNT_0013963433 /DNA_START=100 /DNA_END=375 /DNA_ORIENTATION=+